jgi:hypothetical protein
MGVLESGLASQLCMIDESVYGEAPTLTGALFYDFLNESLELKKTATQGMGIHAGKLHSRAARRVVTRWDAGGQISLELPAQSMNKLLYRMFGSWGQAKAVLTQDGSYGSYSAVHAPGPNEGHSFCIQKGVPAVDGTTEPLTYVGCKITEWEVSVQKGEIAKLNLTVDSRNELGGTMNSDPLNASLPSLLTYSGQPGSVFNFLQASVYTGGTASTTSGVTSVSGSTLAGNVRTANVKYTLPYDIERFFLGNGGFKAEQLQNAVRQISGQFEIEWLSSEAMYDAFAADTATTLQLQFVGPVIGTGTDHSTFTILIPNIHLDAASPKVGGPEVVVQTVPFTGLDDDTNNPIQVTYWTIDSV